MAIYHLSGQIISRSGSAGNIRSSVACAAYRSGEKLFDERSQETKYYIRSIEPVTKILAPKNSPSWAFNREKLWNEVDLKPLNTRQSCLLYLTNKVPIL